MPSSSRTCGPRPPSPRLGSFVRDQVDAAARARRRRGRGRSPFPPGGYLRAARDAAPPPSRASASTSSTRTSGSPPGPRSPLRGAPHAVTLHGTDLRHPRSRRDHPRGAAVLRPRRAPSAPSSPRGARRRRRAAASRSCPAASTSTASARSRAPRRAQRLGLDRRRAVPALPGRPRAGRQALRPRARGRGRHATADARRAFIPSRSRCGSTPPTPSSSPPTHEGFGLAVLEALACDVPVLATPVGVHPAALDGVDGTLCAPFDAPRGGPRSSPTSRPPTRASKAAPAAQWSARQMARRVLDAWGELLRLPVEAPSSGALSA